MNELIEVFFAVITEPIFLALALFLTIIYGWHKLNQPLNRTTKLEDVGFKTFGGFSKEESCARNRNFREVGNPPPPFPNGWYCLVESDDLPSGKVIHVAALGENVAIFRGTDGRVHILDAYCPHLGANLGVGGKVIKENYDVAPQWEVPFFEELSDKNFVYRGRTEGYLDVHIQDMWENAADITHLSVIHKPGLWTGSDLETLNLEDPVGIHVWDAKWAPDAPPHGHVGIMTVKEKIEFFGYKLPFSDVTVVVRQTGPSIGYMRFNMGIFGRAALAFHVLPLDARTVWCIQRFYSTWRFPPILAKLFFWGSTMQLERDTTIWNHKRYMRQPILLKEDSQIALHRRFYSQFYTPNSKTWKEATQNHLDW